MPFITALISTTIALALAGSRSPRRWELFYTTDYILDETLTLLRTRVDHKAAVEFGRIILSSRVVKVLPIIGERWRKAWRLFVKYEDKNFSFTDCTSFVVMKELRLPAALAFDHHFSQMGFITVPGAV